MERSVKREIRLSGTLGMGTFGKEGSLIAMGRSILE